MTKRNCWLYDTTHNNLFEFLVYFVNQTNHPIPTKKKKPCLCRKSRSIARYRKRPRTPYIRPLSIKTRYSFLKGNMMLVSTLFSSFFFFCFVECEERAVLTCILYDTMSHKKRCKWYVRSFDDSLLELWNIFLSSFAFVLKFSSPTKV